MAGEQNITELKFQMTADITGFYGELAKAQNITEQTLTSMTAAHKAFGASRSVEDGLLRDSQDRVIEGLKNWQIALGYSRDELGRLKNAQGQYIDGLTATEQKLGMHKDALGNVYSKNNELVRQGAEAIKLEADAIRNQEKALREANTARQHEEKLRKIDELRAEAAARHEQVEAVRLEEKALKEANAAREQEELAMEKYHKKMDQTLRTLGNNLQHAINWWTTFSAGSGKAAQSTRAATAAVSSFATVAGVLPQIIKWYKSLTLATKGQTTAQVLLNAVSGNWLTIAAGLTVAGGTFLMVSQMEQAAGESEKAKDKVENLTDAVKKLREESEKAGKGTWGIDEINKVIGQNTVSESEKLSRVLDELDTKIADRGKRMRALEKDIQRQKEVITNHSVFTSSMIEGEAMYNWNHKKELALKQQVLGELKAKLESVKNESDQGLIDTMSGLFSGFIESEKSELDKLREQAENIQKGIDKGINPDGKASKSLEIINKKIQGITDAEFQKMIQPLEKYMSQVEKTTKQYRWLDDIIDETAKKSDAYQKACAERAESMKKASLIDAMGEEQYKLYEQINNYVSPWEKFAKEQQNLTELLIQQGTNIEGWIEASKKSEEALLSSSKYGTFLKNARDKLVPFETRLQDGLFELTRIAETLGFTKDELEQAKSDFEKSLAETAQKAEKIARPDLAAAERGSLEAYKIINNQQENRTVKALHDQTKELGGIFMDAADRIVQSHTNNPLANIEFGLV